MKESLSQSAELEKRKKAAEDFLCIIVKALQSELAKDAVQILIPAAMIAYFLLTFVVEPTKVNGISMEPALHTGQRLVMDKTVRMFGVGNYQVGDIVVLYPPGSEQVVIKRVIAVSGDLVEIKDGRVFVNGVPESTTVYTPGVLRLTEIKEGEIFVLGDNRSHSNDSRAFGTLEIDEVFGRVVFSFYPLNTFGPVDNTHAYPSTPRTIEQAKQDERRSNLELVPLPPLR